LRANPGEERSPITEQRVQQAWGPGKVNDVHVFGKVPKYAAQRTIAQAKLVDLD